MRDDTNRAGSIFMLLFLSVFVGAGGLILFLASTTLREDLAPVWWPTAPGEILTAELVDEGAVFRPVVRYRYFVDGEERIGTAVQSNQHSSSDRSAHAEVVARYPVGAEVRVYFDPDRPYDPGAVDASDAPVAAVLEHGISIATYAIFGMGLVFLLLPGLIMWKVAQALLASIRRGIPLRIEGGTTSGPVSSARLSEDFAPSEVVLLGAEYFVRRALAGNTTLLDGETRVSTGELAVTMLAVAVLAHERAGAIRLEVQAAGDDGASSPETLTVVPTCAAAEWPESTAESRLSFGRDEEVSDAIQRWLAQDGPYPWARAVEKGFVLLVLRGLARVRQDSKVRRYEATEAASALRLPGSIAPVVELLSGCKRDRPREWKLLEAQIREGLAKRQGGSSDDDCFDPWYDEAATVRENVEGLRLRGDPAGRPDGRKPTRWALVLLLATITWVMYSVGALGADTRHKHVPLGVLALLYAIWELQRAIRSPRRAPSSPPDQDENPPWVARLSAELRMPMSHEDALAAEAARLSFLYGGPRVRLPYAIVLLPLVALSFVLASFYSWTFLFWPPLLIAVAAALVIVFFVLKMRAGRKITERVQGGAVEEDPGTTAGTPPAPEAARSPDVDPVTRARCDTGLSLESSDLSIEIVRPEAPPETTEASRDRLAEIKERGIAVRMMQRKAVLVLAVLSAGLLATGWALPDASDEILIGLAVLSLGSIVKLAQDRRTWHADAWLPPEDEAENTASSDEDSDATPEFALLLYRLLRGGRSAQRIRWEHRVVPIRPVIVPLVGLGWIVATVANGVLAVYLTARLWDWLILAASVALSTGYLLWVARARQELERRYQVEPARRLLALRVFGSLGMGRFLDLIDSWLWLGPIEQLDGPNTAGASWGDVTKLARGKTDHAVVGTGADVEGALAAFDETFDNQLRYPVNSFQCTDATWQLALDRLIERADVVVMDLAAFSENNRGCAYELQQLLDRVPVERFLLLIDDDTDEACLSSVLHEAWHNLSVESPNRDSRQAVRLFHVGGVPNRRADEGLHDLDRRTLAELDETALVALLRDAAVGRAGPPDTQRIPWARSGLPGVLGVF